MGEARTDGWDWGEIDRSCRRLARAHGMRRSDADDLQQEMLLRAWRARNQCKTPDTPSAWLAAIARNEAQRLRERSARLVPVEPGGVEPAGPDHAESTLERVGVQQAMRRLNLDDRELVRLRYEDDLTQERIAQILKIPEGTVKVRLHRARARLRDDLN